MITLTVKKPPFKAQSGIMIALETEQTGVAENVHTLNKLHSELDKFFSNFREDAVRLFHAESKNSFNTSNTYKIQEELGLQPKIHNRFPSQELEASENASGKEAIEDTQIESTEWVSIRKDELAQLLSNESAYRKMLTDLKQQVELYKRDAKNTLSCTD